MERVPVAVLGSGMGAMGAAHALREAGQAPVCLDAPDYAGGHTASFAAGNGFLFDNGPHISFTKDERIAQLLASAVDGQYRAVEVVLDNIWRGHRIRHPVQLNLHGLPPELIVAVLEDFVSAGVAPPTEIRNYADWLVASYGRTFAETFPMVYGRKYHTTEAANLTTEWLGPRMYRPDLHEILQGALDAPREHKHYVTHFRYPEQGGFGAYLAGLRRGLDVRLEHQLTGLDPVEGVLRFANGQQLRADAVISSVPLPELIPLIDDVPDEVRAAAEALSFSSAMLVNVGVDRADISPAHVTYYYDEDVIFPRLSFPHLLSPHVVPPGAGAIQAEIYYSDRYRPLAMTPEQAVDRVIADLRRCGVLTDDDRLLVTEARNIKYANVIWDAQRADAVATVHGYLNGIGVVPCGRYGDWVHSWTDEAFMSGERAGHAVLAGARLGAPVAAMAN